MSKNYLIMTIVLSIFFSGCEKNKSKSTLPKHSSFKLFGTYEVNGITSRIDWSGEKIAYGHNGTLMLKKGIIEVDLDGNISGDFEIDMQTINVISLEGGKKNSLEGHLKADDFFGVEKFPRAYIKFNFNKSKIINDAAEIDADLKVFIAISFATFLQTLAICLSKFLTPASLV